MFLIARASQLFVQCLPNITLVNREYAVISTVLNIKNLGDL